VAKQIGHSNGRCWSIDLDDEYLYSGGGDKLAKKWNLATGKLELTFAGLFNFPPIRVDHKNVVRCVLLHGNYLFTASFDSIARQWDKTTGTLIRAFSGLVSSQNSLFSLAAKGDFLFVGSQELMNLIVQWRISDGAYVRNLDGIFPLH
jgi:WD40 repeat protein